MPTNKERERSKSKTTGTGLFLLKNTTNSDIMLPKPSFDGKTIIRPNGTFRGDSYLLESMRGSVAIIEDLSNHVNDRIITEQPPTITTSGEVVYNDKKESVEANKDILLTEYPIDGVTILND